MLGVWRNGREIDYILGKQSQIDNIHGVEGKSKSFWYSCDHLTWDAERKNQR